MENKIIFYSTVCVLILLTVINIILMRDSYNRGYCKPAMSSGFAAGMCLGLLLAVVFIEIIIKN